MAKKDEIEGSVRRERARTPDETITHTINHPTRLEAFLATWEEATSPTEVAARLGKSLGTVSHHMKELRKDGVIELVRKVERRGAIEHYYRATKPPEVDAEEWKALPPRRRSKIAMLTLQAIVAHSLAALRHGKMAEDDDMYLFWTPMKLSARGLDEVAALKAEVRERMIAIKERHGADGDGEDEGATRIAAMLWFERGRPRA